MRSALASWSAWTKLSGFPKDLSNPVNWRDLKSLTNFLNHWCCHLFFGQTAIRQVETGHWQKTPNPVEIGKKGRTIELCVCNTVLLTWQACWLEWKKGQVWQGRDDPGLKMGERAPEQSNCLRPKINRNNSHETGSTFALNQALQQWVRGRKELRQHLPRVVPRPRRSCSQWGRGSRGRRTRGRPAWGSGAAPRAGWNWRERGSWGGARWIQTRKAPPGRERNWGKWKGSSTCVKLSPARVSEWRLEVCKFARIASTCSTLNPLLLNPTTLRWQTALATPDTLSWNGKLKREKS